MPLPRLPTAAHALDLSAEPAADVGWWRVYNLFRGKTASLRALGAHVSWLEPGHSVHPPHVHPGEELCVMVEGELELHLPTEGVHGRIVPGRASFISGDLAHGLKSVGEVPALYFILRWLADPLPAAPPGRLVYAECLDLAWPAPGEGPARTTHVLETPTDYLRTLRCELTTIEPGTDGAPLAATHDLALIVLDGAIGAAGTHVSAPGIVVVRSGASSAVSNDGPGAASYLAVELDAHPASAGRRVVNDMRWYSRRTPLRRPMTELPELAEL